MRKKSRDEKGTSKIIEITGKKSFNCTKCGLTTCVPPRGISIGKLRHMREAQKVSELLKKTGADSAVTLTQGF